MTTSVELAGRPYLLHRDGKGIVVANGQQHFRRTALHDLVQNKYRKFVEQVGACPRLPCRR